MPEYKFTAKYLDGTPCKGRQAARDLPELISLLRERQLFLLEYEELGRSEQRSYRLKSMQLVDFNYQLGSMLKSGVSLMRAFEIMLRRDLKPKERAVYQGVLDQLISGVSLSDAMQNMNGAFPELLINMYRAGEANGAIDKTALQMADHYEKDHRLRSKISAATAYPKFLGGLLVLVIIAVFNFILPRFLGVYGDMELPRLTQVVISISKLFTDYLLYTGIVVLLFILGFSMLKQVHSVKIFFDRSKLRLPVIGKLLRSIYTARFCRTLSSLYASGLTILRSLEVSRSTIGNAYIEEQFDQVIATVRDGGALSGALDQVEGFDSKLAMVVMVGEETGQLDDILLNTADNFDYEAARSTDKLTDVLAPFMIILMAAIVAFVIISVMLPIYSLYGQIDTYGMSTV